MKLPSQPSLIHQTAEALRQGIRQGVWRDALPGERHLAGQLTVSRPTLRHALEILEHEKWITLATPRRRRRILKRHPVAGSGMTPSVTLLSNDFPDRASFRLRCIVDELRHVLPKYGVDLQIRPYPHVAPERMAGALETLTQSQQASAWILARAARDTQKWFARRAFPTLVYGTCDPAVGLPSLAIDHHAVCRHAVGTFLSKGHRRLLMVSPREGTVGDRDSEREFLSAGASLRSRGAQCRILAFDGSRRDLVARLDELWRTTSPPLAILCDAAIHAVTLFSHALHAGMNVPADVSLIARVYEPVLSWTCPVIAHYREDIGLITNKMRRLIVEMIRNGSLPPKAHRLIPEYVPGETVADVTDSSGHVELPEAIH